MDAKLGAGGLLALGSSEPGYVFPGAGQHPTPKPFPKLDEHVVPAEDSPYEMIRGEMVLVQPAKPEHADAQVRAAVAIDAFLREEYVAATEMLTRVNEGSDFATDVSVRKRGINPETNERYLEELSFEVVNTQTVKAMEIKADELAQRGVRRVFAIFVKSGAIREWSRAERRFMPLDKDGVFDDPVLVRPMVVGALVDRTLAQIEIIRTLEKEKHPEIQRIRQDGVDEGRKKGLNEGRKKGLNEGRKEALAETTGKLRTVFKRLLHFRFDEIPPAALQRIEEADADTIDAWAAKAATASTIEEVIPIQDSKLARKK